MFLRRITWTFFLTFLIFFFFSLMVLHRTPSRSFYGSKVNDLSKGHSGVNDPLVSSSHDSRSVISKENPYNRKNRHKKFNLDLVTDKPIDKMKNVKLCPYNLTVQTPGRLGNLMFAYASMLGIAKKLKRTPVIDKDNPLRLFFKVSASPIDTKLVNLSTWTKFEPHYSAAYEHRIENTPCRDNLLLDGYFQSWKYFQEVEHTIRQEFTFKDLIKLRAVQFLESSIRNHFRRNVTRSDVVLIGIHVRRSDMTDYESRQRGYTVASRHYILSAMSLLAVQYRRVLFVVCSDDIFWAQQNVHYVKYPVVFAENFHAILDLAILSLCDHVIMTVGSFGWWGAYLAGGKTIYVSDFPRKHSMLDDEYRPKDYFYPGWVGIPSG